MQIVHHLTESKTLKVTKDKLGFFDKKQLHSAIWAVQQFALQNVHRHSMKKGADVCLQKCIANRESPPEQHPGEVHFDKCVCVTIANGKKGDI